MDFKYYNLFCYAWNSVHYRGGMMTHENEEHFLPLFERVSKLVDPAKGKPSTYIYKCLRWFIGHQRKKKDLHAKWRYQYIDQNKDSVHMPTDKQFIDKQYIEKVLTGVKFTDAEQELFNLLMYEEPGINVRQASFKLGKYSVSRGDQIYRSIKKKIDNFRKKENL